MSSTFILKVCKVCQQRDPAGMTLEQEGFSILPGVFGQEAIQHLIDSISHIADERGVRSRGGVYAIANLLPRSWTVA